jgi:hypothetical protein
VRFESARRAWLAIPPQEECLLELTLPMSHRDLRVGCQWHSKCCHQSAQLAVSVHRLPEFRDARKLAES